MFTLRETLKTVFNEIVKDEKIMKLMDLPTIYDSDTEDIKIKKTNQLLRKVITFSSENPIALGNKVIPDVKIGEEVYKNPGKIRMTITNLQGVNLSNTNFGQPRFEIDIYHLNEDTEKALEIIKLLSRKFSDRKIDVEWEDDDNIKHISPTRLTCIGAITQAPNINFYEKSGIRFSYYSSYYSLY